MHEPTLQNIIDKKSLRWIFVGGKGGVGKTTTSCALATVLSKHRSSVLILSTDPAHNLSDAFDQQFGKQPTLVKGYKNLYAMEIDPSTELEKNDDGGSEYGDIFKDIGGSLPGIDEAMSFSKVMEFVRDMKYEVVVFDTAPTGHTLRFLSFPTVIQRAYDRFQGSQLGSMVSSMSSMLGAGAGALENLKSMKNSIDEVNRQFKDNTKTTFVCVCEAQFLSVYETERLVQELWKTGIDARNIVVNKLTPEEYGHSCKKCKGRLGVQSRYLEQIDDLYSEDFHLVRVPDENDEVRGADKIEGFSKYLITKNETKF